MGKLLEMAKAKQQEKPKEIIIPVVTIQEIEKIFVPTIQEEKKPKIILPKISPKRYQKIRLKEKIEVTSDNIRTSFNLITGEIPRNTIESNVFDLATFLNDYEIVKEGRNVFFIKK